MLQIASQSYNKFAKHANKKDKKCYIFTIFKEKRGFYCIKRVLNKKEEHRSAPLANIGHRLTSPLPIQACREQRYRLYYRR